MIKVKIIGTVGGITVVADYNALPSAASASGEFYWCQASVGVPYISVLFGGDYYPVGLYYSNGVTWEYMDTPSQATQAEVDAGVVTDKWVSPATLSGSSQWGNFVPYNGATSDVDLGTFFLLAARGIFSLRNSAAAVIESHNVGNGSNYTINITEFYVGLNGNNDYLTASIEVEMDGTSVSDGRMTIKTEGTSTINFKYGRVGIGSITVPTAYLHIPAVSTSASTAPIKLTLGGTLMTTPEAGAIEATDSHIYWTDSGGTRHQLDRQARSVYMALCFFFTKVSLKKC